MPGWVAQVDRQQQVQQELIAQVQQELMAPVSPATVTGKKWEECIIRMLCRDLNRK